MPTVKDDRGYLIWAIGKEYLECAVTCAKSIRFHTPDAKIALLSDCHDDVDYGVFDYIETFPYPVNYNNLFANDWQVFYASPFRETIKIEADMIVPHSIDHWWLMFEKRDVVLTTKARNWQNQIITNRTYRKIFDANDLPDVYNAITYWRLSKEAKNFFDLVRNLFDNWNRVQTQIKMGMNDDGTTDLVYAIAAKMIGIDKVTLPNTTYPSIIHMKGKVNNLIGEDWTKELVWEFDGPQVRINTIDQEYPFHYYIKDFNKKLKEYYHDKFF